MRGHPDAPIAIPPGARITSLRFVETMPFHRFAYPSHQPVLWSADDRGAVCAVGAWWDRATGMVSATSIGIRAPGAIDVVGEAAAGSGTVSTPATLASGSGGAAA